MAGVRLVQQTHWVGGSFPAAVPPGMDHAIVVGHDNDVHVTTIASLVTRAYGPTVEPISDDEAPIEIPMTDAQLADAERYEQNIRELMSWSEPVTG